MSQLILTQPRKKLLSPFPEKWNKLVVSTTPCDHERVTELAGMIYRNLDLPPPHVHIAASPLEALLHFSMRAEVEREHLSWGSRDENSDQSLHRRLLVRILGDRKVLNPSGDEWVDQQLRTTIRWAHRRRMRSVFHQVQSRLYEEGEQFLHKFLGADLPSHLQKPVIRGLLMLANSNVDQMEGFDLCKTDYLLHGLELAMLRPLAPLVELAEQVEGFFCDDQNMVIVDRPSELHLDASFRLHNPDGVALRYRDGFVLHAIGGVALPSTIIDHPENITVEMIQGERNAELARVMLLKFGEERYAEHFEPKGEPWKDTQGFSSQLLETTLGHRTLARVRVTNSTPEPDGTHKIYWLRVPPGLSCAHEALAQIHVNPFRKDWKAYNPAVET